MTRYTQLAVAAVLGGAVASPSPARAQFIGGAAGLRVGPGLPGTQFLPPAATNFHLTVGFRAQYFPFGPSVASFRTYSGPVGFYLYARNRGGYGSGSYPLYPTTGGYMSGGAAGNPALEAARADFARAQKAAVVAAMPAKAAIHDQWAYEKLGTVGVAGVKLGADAPDAVVKALAVTDERELGTGEPLNHLVVAALAAEKKAGKVDSAFLPPNLLADLKFSGPVADAVNLLRRAGRLDYPAGFEQPALAGVKEAIDREFAAATAPVLVGKAADPARVAKLEAAVAKAREALGPQVREMSFEDATAARRFLNQLDAATRALKGPSTATLVEPAWQVEGTNVAGLVRYMGRHNLLFAPADSGTEDRYAAVHRGLGAYLYALTEAQKKK